MMMASRRRFSGDDDGYSLADLLVGLSVMSVLMVVTLGAIAEMYLNVTRTENTSFAREQVGTSFRRLDKELRYATWISSPGPPKANGAYYMEYAVPSPPDKDGNPVDDACRQLKYDNGVLSLVGWLPPATPGKPTQIGTDLALTAGAPPFTLITPGSTYYSSLAPGPVSVGKNFAPQYDQVRLQFKATFGRVTLPLDAVFTAQNTYAATTTPLACLDEEPS
jgi:hypothetical protein